MVQVNQHYLKILSGELDSQTGHVSLGKNERLAVLKQDHYAYEDERVLDVVIKGHERLYEVMKEKDEIYMKPDFSDEDGIRAAELEGEFANEYVGMLKLMLLTFYLV